MKFLKIRFFFQFLKIFRVTISTYKIDYWEDFISKTSKWIKNFHSFQIIKNYKNLNIKKDSTKWPHHSNWQTIINVIFLILVFCKSPMTLSSGGFCRWVNFSFSFLFVYCGGCHHRDFSGDHVHDISIINLKP